MANIKSFPNNQDVFIGAEDVMKWLHGRTSGVFGADDNASVSALVDSAMEVQVSDGLGWMADAGHDGIVWWNDYEKVNGIKLKFPIEQADGVLNRIDRIIVEWQIPNYTALPEIKVLKGEAKSNPTAPALTNNSTVRQISLARVYVAAGTTAITASMITDERLDPSVCGLVTESIKIDTTVMHNQFEALLSSVSRLLDDLQQGTATALKQRTTAVLAGNGWEGEHQTVVVGGVTEANDVFISVPEAYYEAYTDAGIRCVEQSAGQLKFSSESAPDEDITVGILIIS